LNKKYKTLIFTPLRFFSQDDEDLFFKWINLISCIQSYKGIGRELHLKVSSKDISNNDFINLRAIFKRYKLKNIEQLKELFLNNNNKHWFD
jgi:hypothetical protein